jgi:pantothenate kinase
MLELSIFVDVPDVLLRERLEQRHQKSGRTVQEALKKIENIDMPNARYVRSHHLEADVHFRANYYDF